MDSEADAHLLESERDDDAFVARFAQAYRGRHSPEDALDWALDPEHPSRGGRPFPAVDLRRMRDRVYSARSDQPGYTEDVEALRNLERDLDLDRSATREAVAAARASRRPAPMDAATLESPTTATSDPSPTDVRPARRRGALLIAGVAIVSLVAGLVIGSGSLRRPTVTEGFVGDFGRAQTEGDIPGVELGEEFLPETLRRINDGAAPGSPMLYTGRRTDNRICLISEIDQTTAAASCVTDGVFTTRGIVLSWTSEVAGELVATSISMRPNGEFQMSMGPVG